MEEYEEYVEKMKNLKPHSNKEEPSGLEAFEELKTVMHKLFGGVERCEKSLDIVERSLKRLEHADENERILSIIRKHLSIIEPVNDTTLVFDIDLWDAGSQKEEFATVKEWLDKPWYCDKKE